MPRGTGSQRSKGFTSCELGSRQLDAELSAAVQMPCLKVLIGKLCVSALKTSELDYTWTHAGEVFAVDLEELGIGRNHIIFLKLDKI